MMKLQPAVVLLVIFWSVPLALQAQQEQKNEFVKPSMEEREETAWRTVTMFRDLHIPAFVDDGFEEEPAAGSPQFGPSEGGHMHPTEK